MFTSYCESCGKEFQPVAIQRSIIKTGSYTGRTQFTKSCAVCLRRKLLAEQRSIERERQAELRRAERVERERQAELRRIERERQAELRRIEREREAERRRAEQQERASRVPSKPASPARNTRTSNADVASQLTSLSELFRQGVLTSEQFEAAKNKLLGLDSPTSPSGRHLKETIVIDGGNVIRTAGSADVTITVNGKTVQSTRKDVDKGGS